VRIEVLCTGDELLTGLTADTNSPYFMGKVLELGEKVAFAQVVPDDREAITHALRAVRDRADAVLVSGGLGPTADDFTAECAAAAAGVPLVEHAPTLERLRQRFAKRGLELTPNNARQARVPEGAEVLANPVGSAPMFIQTLGRCRLFFVPGVPREYRALVDGEVLPRLAQAIAAQPGRRYHALRILRTVALAESHLDAMVAPLAPSHPAVTFGFRTQGPENQLKLLVEAESGEDVLAEANRAEAACREVLGAYVYGSGDHSLASVVAGLLQSRGETLSLAESCTGGGIAQLLSDVPGASAWLWGGAVSYSEASKRTLVSVSGQTLEAKGMVSAEVAQEMAEGIRRVASSTWSLSTTGFAGPAGGTSNDAVGTVYLGLSGPGGTVTQRHVFGGDRIRIRDFGSIYALELLRRTMMGLAPQGR
jgi:nicotinamide-nucleotide amidase